MRVKRLEIQGFKSFKDKTVIHFDHSITGIVGPNGCGKSNIVDAFFWVMGEQSYKHMRGNSSEDLIFNGSSKYSPLGIAEATLVMETDVVDLTGGPTGATTQDIPLHLKTKEIAVTRRIYRSGEGEYFINGTLARLKDIQELFMDTGVGAKGYSVIEQGQIGKIVNAKPEERRLLIEEAAGIAKYKMRKKESLRKMEATQGNLSRLTDIIQEIEKNLGSLERQAQKAKQYNKYKNDLLQKEITWGRRKYRVFQQKLETLKIQRETLEQDLAVLRAELQTSENSIEVDRIQLLTETKDAEVIQANIQQLAGDLSQEKSALELSRRRQGDLASQLETLGNEQKGLEVSLESDSQKLAENEKQSEESGYLYEQAASEVREMNDTLSQLRKSSQEARSHLDATQRQLMSGINQISSLNSKSASLSSKAESARAQVERFNVQLEEQVQRTSEVQEELEKLRMDVETLRKQKEVLHAEKKEQSAKIQNDEQESRRLDKEKNDSLRSLTQLRSRLQSLEELDQSHEGLADGPKAALDWAKENGQAQKIVPLTDLLDVTSGYETVLQSWLENRIENLMVQDSSFILPLLEEIRDSKQGRVSLQLISKQFKAAAPKAKSSFADVQATLEKHGFKVLGQLADFVKRSQSAKDFDESELQSLVGQVCVVESASPIAAFVESDEFKNISGWSIAAMDGVALESQGVFRGGSLNSTGVVGILRRKKSIEELKVQVAEADSAHHILEDTAAKAKQAIELSRAKLQALQADLQAVEIQLAAMERDVHQTDRALSDAKNRRSSLERDVSEMTLEVDRSSEEREKVEAQLQELIESRSDLEGVISEAEATSTEKENRVREQEDELQGVRVREASLRERVNSLKREVEATKSLISDRERRLTEIKRILERATREQTQYTGGESQLAENIELLTLNLSNARGDLALVKDRIEQANAKVNSTLERLKELHKSGDHKTSESTHLALEIEKLSGELSHLVLNLEEKYGQGCLSGPAPLTVSEGDEPPVSIDRDLSPEEEIQLGEDVERLRERIRRLGEVNVMAIEEFETLQKRYEHILKEKSDLERSLENLQDAIEHINKTSEERFKKAFEAIAERFERLFPVIFGGGSARLSLVYPEGSTDILDAGVDILAQPPGKKVSNITLLSGGEKALTAVSLIFAIFMVKPSPFCVLDEVDAPLDDANIGKFNALLREMSVKSQFILITHNKKTMELNDTLYGVTMEEPGVSKMVSIEMH